MSNFKLELKHIAPYLPYGLRFCSIMDDIDDNMIRFKQWTLNGITFLFGDYCLNTLENSDAYPINSVKPILRPLTEIKDIEEIMDEFSEFSWEGFQNHFFDNVLGRSLNCFDVVNYTIVELCFKHNLDIFGLIEKDLAIDINTLNKYKNEPF